MPGPTPDPRSTPPGVPVHSDSTAGHGVDAPVTRAADPLPAPARIGPYEIVRTLGRGGMSTVYLARDDRDNGEVALKVIPNGADADPTDLARFHDEAEAVARLHHPNIVRLYEAGEAAGVAYLAMEYVPGGNLYKHITRGGPLAATEAAGLLEPLARAAHFAHTHGVIHRDLKPSNILLCPPSSDGSPACGPARPDGDPGTPKIADFGLARLLDRSLRLTRSGVALGTPHYMAPEQAHGQGDLVGPAADVYALGAILYECLTGHPPFSGSSPLETMEQVVHRKPVPPSHLRNGIPPDLEAICLRCLEKSPGRRYPTAGSLADALQLFRAGKPVALPYDRPTERIVIPRRRWLPIALSAGAVAVALVVVSVGLTWLVSGRVHRGKVQAARTDVAVATQAERRARLDEAIARCERGDIGGGLDRIRALGADDALPVNEIVAAWETRLLTRAPLPPALRGQLFAINPAAQLVAMADADTVHVRKASDGSAVSDPWKADGPVTALAWDVGGIRLAVGTESGRVSVGDGSHGTFQPSTVVGPAGKPVHALRVTAAELRVAFGTTIRTYAADDGPATEDVPDIGSLTAVALGPDGEVAAINSAGAVKVFDPHGRRWLDLPPDGDASAVAYASDGNAIAVGTRGGTVRLWDAVARAPLTDAFPVGGPVTSISVGTSATTYTVLANGAESVALTCPRPFVGGPIRLGNQPDRDVLGVAFTADGRGLFVTSPAGVSVWQLGPGGRYVRTKDHAADGRFPAGGKLAACCLRGAHAKDPAALLVGGSGGRVLMVDPDKGSELAAGTVTGAEEITAIATGPDGRVCVCGRTKDRRGLVGHWDGGMAPSPGHVHRLDTDVLQGAFLPDGSAVVLGCEDGAVHVWDPVTGRDIRSPLECGSPVLAVAVNDDGSRILAGCADGTAHLWDRSSGSKLQVVRHRAAVRAAAFHGVDLLTASADGTARRWDAATGLPLGPPLVHADAIAALATRGPLVATGGRDRTVRVWRLP